MTSGEVRDWLDSAVQGLPGVAGLLNLRSSITRAEYDEAIARIKWLIAEGETYQVNFTYRLTAEAYGNPIALFRKLRMRQPVAYGALIRLPDSDDQTEWILSLSPELFVRHLNGIAHAKPMKGTAPRHPVPEIDRENERWLANDVKNRAENLMIVDLVRNDLGRLAVIGSVQVPTLFSVEALNTVFQMTSTVAARLRSDVDFPDVLRALFPSGSVTGAPKIQTMKRIAELESTPRGIYTGAIGWVEANPERGVGVSCPDFCLSVAIRTIALGRPVGGMRPATFGVGGGVVIDSTSEGEYEESLLKTRFAQGLDPGFNLIETMWAGRSRGIPLFERHLLRLSESAKALGFSCDIGAITQEVMTCLSHLEDDEPRRLRLSLSFDGSIEVVCSRLLPLPPGRAKVLLARAPLPDSEAALSGYKTSNRETYDRALQEAESAGAFDTLFFNSASELTEGARSNVFVLLDGQWCTPASICGGLPGVMRAVVLEERSRSAVERKISIDELRRAEDVFVCNALRGIVSVQVTWS